MRAVENSTKKIRVTQRTSTTHKKMQSESSKNIAKEMKKSRWSVTVEKISGGRKYRHIKFL